jgi:hypothetical protein
LWYEIISAHCIWDEVSSALTVNQEIYQTVIEMQAVAQNAVSTARAAVDVQQQRNQIFLSVF